MSVRSISALLLGAVLVLAGCSEDKGAAVSSDEPAQSSAPAGPTYTAFADFPGEELTYVEQGVVPVGLRLKLVDTVWQTELADKIADPDGHYLVVYVALTGEAEDRGAPGRMNYADFELRFAADGDACGAVRADNAGICHYRANPIATPEAVADKEWRDHRWASMDASVPPDLAAGATMISALAFTIEDTVEPPADTEFCAPGRDKPARDNCVTVALPTEPRG